MAFIREIILTSLEKISWKRYSLAREICAIYII